MAGGGNAARSGLQSTDATKMSGDANGAAAVTANAAHRATRSDGGSLSATRAACGVGKIPRIAGFSSEKIVGFVGHQKFGRVGVAEKNGSRSSQTGHERGVGASDIIFAEQRASGAWPAGNVDAAFDSERNAGKRPEWLILRDGGFRGASLCLSAVGVQMDEGVELRLKGLDAA